MTVKTNPKISLWEKVKTKYAPKVGAFISKWSDIILFLPISLILFIFNDKWIKLLDPTASSMNPEFLTILNFNILKFSAIVSIAYFIYNLFFHDFFNKNWEDKIGNKVAGAIIHLVLWLTTLGLTAFVLLKDL